MANLEGLRRIGQPAANCELYPQGACRRPRILGPRLLSGTNLKDRTDRNNRMIASDFPARQAPMDINQNSRPVPPSRAVLS